MFLSVIFRSSENSIRVVNAKTAITANSLLYWRAKTCDTYRPALLMQRMPAVSSHSPSKHPHGFCNPLPPRRPVFLDTRELAEMAKLEDLTPATSVRGIFPDGLVTVVSVQWFGSEALELTYKDPGGRVANELLYRHDEPRTRESSSRVGPGASTATASSSGWCPRRTASASPICSIPCWRSTPRSSSRCRTRSPPSTRRCCRGSRCASCSPTTPAPARRSWPGLLIKELIARGDLQRCLIVCPGSLAEQWQDELYRRFHLPFEILTNDKLEAARTGNWFLETNLVIARLDKLSRNEDVQQKLQAPDCRWDLVVCDEAHKMSATVLRRRGQVHQALPARPAALDADAPLPADDRDAAQRQGRGLPALHGAARRRPLRGPLPRRRPHGRRLRPDAPHGQGEPAQVRRTPLFPERSPTPSPTSSRTPRRALYKAVTEYVREEFNRAEALENDKRAGTVGFALTILQRRLASSPEAIYQSLRRRRERLESRLRELECCSAAARSAGDARRTCPPRRRGCRGSGGRARQRSRGRRGGDPRPGHRRPHHRGASHRDRDADSGSRRSR